VRLLHPVIVQLDAQILQGRAEPGAPGVLAQHQAGAFPPDVRRIHDLVRGPLLEHAVLMDSGLMGERVLANDRLVHLDLDAGQRADKAAGRDQARGVDVRLDAAELIGPRLERHHDLLKGGVAGALADAVDGYLDLPRASLHRDQRVSGGHAEVIVAVNGEDDVVRFHDVLIEVPNKVVVLEWRRVANSVGNVQGRRARPDGGIEDLDHELAVGARRALTGALAVVDEAPGEGNGVLHLPQHLPPRPAAPLLPVDIRRGDESMDALAVARLDGLRRRLDIATVRSRQTGDRHAGPVRASGDLPNGLEVAWRGRRKAGFDHINTKSDQRIRHIELFFRRKRRSRRLLAVPKRRVEHDHAWG